MISYGGEQGFQKKQGADRVFMGRQGFPPVFMGRQAFLPVFVAQPFSPAFAGQQCLIRGTQLQTSEITGGPSKR